MFYSHEVLTSRRYGVATVWLVATLGSKSTLKKVSRKAILDVNVTKACETIVEPEAPMALRLQSNLLYGVSRVHLEQCGYVLADAEAARTAMRTMLRSIKITELNTEGANKARPDQLTLQDDPNFLPHLECMLLNSDTLGLGRAGQDTQSNLSPYDSSQLHTGSQHTIGGLMLPPSNSSFTGDAVGGLDLLSVRGDMGPGKKLDTPRLLEDDLGLMLDDDYFFEDEAVRQPSAHYGSHGHPHLTSNLDGSRAQNESYGQQQNFESLKIRQDDGKLSGQDTVAMNQQDEGAQIIEQETTSETASASMARKQRKPKVLPLDGEISHPNRVIAGWCQDYVERMREMILSKQSYKLAALAKKNAQHWVLGAGVSLGQRVCEPLEVFSGAGIIKAFTGINLLHDGQKRPREEEHQPNSGRRVRARGEPASEELARGDQDARFADGIFQDDGYTPWMDDNTIEQGREAPTPIDDGNLSSIFPWNHSVGSRRPTDAHATSASVGIGSAQLTFHARGGSRTTSASPLVGRGIPHPELDHFQLPGSDIDMGNMTGDEEFELFGPAAQVTTQTAVQSQWQRAALGNEAINFLDFVQAAITEQALIGDHKDTNLVASIDLDILLPPQDNSQVVSAQAMLHILTLCTKSLLQAEQEMPFGPINLSIIAI